MVPNHESKEAVAQVPYCFCPKNLFLRRKQPGIRAGKNWQLYHDNASAHSTHVIKGFLDKNNTMKKTSGACRRRSSRGASKSGRGAGKSVCTCKGSILKEIK